MAGGMRKTGEGDWGTMAERVARTWENTGAPGTRTPPVTASPATSGTAWSLADDHNRQARLEAYRAGFARHVWVIQADGTRVPGLATSWRPGPPGTTEGLVVHLAWLSSPDGPAAWTQVTEWIPAERLEPVQH